LLTDLERKRIRSYIKADGEKTQAVRILVGRAKRHLPLIQEDLQLLKQLVETYEANREREKK
jgi:hypothetical protein